MKQDELNELNELSNEELKKRIKFLAIILGSFIGVLMILLILAIYISIRDGFSVLLVIPFALSPILIINFNSLKKAKNELLMRNE